MLKIYHPNRLAQFQKNHLAEFMEIEASRLRSQGYDFNYARHLLTSVSYFGDWLKSNRIPVKEVDKEIAKTFLKQFKPPTIRKDSEVTTRRICIKTAAYGVVRYVREYFPEARQKTPIQREVFSFHAFLHDDCSLAKITREKYVHHIERFLNYFFTGKRISLKSLTPRMIRDYVMSLPSSSDEQYKKKACSTLNSYFRFLTLHGKNVGDLPAGVPSFQSKYQAPTCSILEPEDLKGLLNAVDRSTPIGKRTYASILCQCDLGLRVSDVARIALDDIDWRSGRIRIDNFKEGKLHWLPLPKRGGEAIADYLKNGRPASEDRRVFLSHFWRRNFPGKGSHLYYEISKLWKATGMDDRFSGTHILRHYAAMRMKQNKCSIKVISSILGHSTLQTTAIYAKIDIPALRTISQDWPVEEVDHEN